MHVHGSFWFIFHSILIMYSAIYVPFMTREVHIFTLKLSFRNMNHTCSIRFDTFIMKRYFLFFSQRYVLYFYHHWLWYYVYICMHNCTCIFYIHSRWITIYALRYDTNCICKYVEDIFAILKNVLLTVIMSSNWLNKDFFIKQKKSF